MTEGGVLMVAVRGGEGRVWLGGITGGAVV